MDDSAEPSEALLGVVFTTAQELLRQRKQEESEVETWVTGTEIAHVTGISKTAVHAALQKLGNGRLHIRDTQPADIEVLGVDHGPDADSLESPVDQETPADQDGAT